MVSSRIAIHYSLNGGKNNLRSRKLPTIFAWETTELLGELKIDSAVPIPGVLLVVFARKMLRVNAISMLVAEFEQHFGSNSGLIFQPGNMIVCALHNRHYKFHIERKGSFGLSEKALTWRSNKSNLEQPHTTAEKKLFVYRKKPRLKTWSFNTPFVRKFSKKYHLL